MNNSPDDINTEITPTEFEELVHSYLSNLGETLEKFEAKHNILITRNDGTYQIDVFAEFEVLGGRIKVLIECKRYKNKVKRETVQLLNDKLKSIGAQKGMIFTTSGFQSGAIKYAEEHGIALVTVIEGRYTYVTKSHNSETYPPPDWVKIPKFVGVYSYGNRTAYLESKYLTPLEEFLFN